jgi:hypothetical protein
MVKLTNMKSLQVGGSNVQKASGSNVQIMPSPSVVKPKTVVCDGDTCEYCSG